MSHPKYNVNEVLQSDEKYVMLRRMCNLEPGISEDLTEALLDVFFDLLGRTDSALYEFKELWKDVGNVLPSMLPVVRERNESENSSVKHPRLGSARGEDLGSLQESNKRRRKTHIQDSASMGLNGTFILLSVNLYSMERTHRSKLVVRILGNTSYSQRSSSFSIILLICLVFILFPSRSRIDRAVTFFLPICSLLFTLLTMRRSEAMSLRKLGKHILSL